MTQLGKVLLQYMVCKQVYNNIHCFFYKEGHLWFDLFIKLSVRITEKKTLWPDLHKTRWMDVASSRKHFESRGRYMHFCSLCLTLPIRCLFGIGEINPRDNNKVQK